MLIQSDQLNGILNDNNVIIFDTRFSLPGPDFDPDLGLKLYKENHIPGAIYVDLERDLSQKPTPSCGRHPLPTQERFLDKIQEFGLSPEKKVVIYDDKNCLIAARFWWMLRFWIDHQDVYLLDGGFPNWIKSGFSVDTKIPSVITNTYRYHINSSTHVNTDDIFENLKQETSVIIDARALLRYLGQEENIDPVAGHIPGALNIPCTGNFDENGNFLSTEKLKQRFNSAINSVESAASITHMCGSGVTACHNLFAMELAGLHGSKLYPGSWSEWIRDPSRPVTAD